MKTAETYVYAEHTRRKEGGNPVVLLIRNFKGRSGEVPFVFGKSGKQ